MVNKIFIYVFLVVLIATTACNKEEFGPGSSDDYLLTKIQYFDNAYSKLPAEFTELEYDEIGRIQREAHFVNPAQLAAYKIYEYEGPRISRIIAYSNANNSMKQDYIVKYSYDGDLLIREDHFDGKGNTATILRNQYEDGMLVTTNYEFIRPITSKAYAADHKDLEETRKRIFEMNPGTRFARYSYEYGKVVRKEFYNDSEQISASLQVVYHDLHGVPTRQIIRDGQGKVISSKEIGLDAEGNMITLFQTEQNGERYPIEINQYQGGLLTEKTVYNTSQVFEEEMIVRYHYERK